VIQIRTQKIIQAPRWKILRLISAIKDFPKYMPNVKQCEVLEKHRRGAVTAWKVEVDKMSFSWKQRDDLDVPNFTMRFELLSGDLKTFSGSWILREHSPGVTEVTVEAVAEIGIPMLDEVIGGVIAEKLNKNFELMLQAIDERVTLQRYKNIRHRATSNIRGFAVIGHPYNLNHLIRYFKFFKPDFELPSQEFLMKVFELAPSYKAYNIERFKSITGREVDGYFVMCPIIPVALILSPDKVIEKVIQACKVAEQLGVGIATLGGFTSIAGEQFGRMLTSSVHVPITTGNTYTVAMVIDGIEKAARMMGLNMAEANVTIIGGTGDIGGACARILAEKVAEITITSRSEKNLAESERLLSYYGKARVSTSRDNNEAVKNAHIVIAAASSTSTIVDFNCFRSGAIICDVGYPKNISYTTCDRKDILIFSGGTCSIPSDFNTGFDVGLPNNRVLYGCFAEAILLELEERYENFSWGKGNITPERVQLIRDIGKKHGFEVAPFFWGSRTMGEREIEEIVRLKNEKTIR